MDIFCSLFFKSKKGPLAETLQLHLFSSERQECNVTCTLDSNCHLTLMLSTVARNTTRQNLATLGNVTTQLCYILIINLLYLIYAETANLFTRSSASITLDQSIFPPSIWNIIPHGMSPSWNIHEISLLL